MDKEVKLSNFNKNKTYSNPKDEGYTPSGLVGFFTRGKMDEFMDPATTEEVAKKQGFKKFFTQEDDGLKQEGEGDVGCNPPFSLKDDFIKKVVTT